MKINKKGIELEMIVKLIIILVIVAIFTFIAILLQTKGINALDYVKELLKFK